MEPRQIHQLATAASETQEHLPLWVEYAKVFVIPVLSFFAAIVGLWVASWLTEERDRKKEKVRVEKEIVYTAILLTAHLEKIIEACLQIAFDTGTRDGRPTGEFGEHQVTAQPPEFDPLKIDSDWRSLPVQLMQGILELPHKIERLNASHAGIWEFDSPPDYTAFFDARQYDFSKLGIETIALMYDLRKFAGIPLKEQEHSEWSRDHFFKEKIEKIEARRFAEHERLYTRGSFV